MTIRPTPRMVRTIVMTRNISIRPLGPHHNGQNCIDEGLLSIGEDPLHCCLLIPSTVA
jgi:hypothetical protein